MYNEKIGIESLAAKYGYFSTNIKNSGRNERVKYKPESNLISLTKHAKTLFGSDLRKIRNVINLFKPLDTAQCEIVTTLYACWNDLLILKKAPSDLEILDEFRNNWHIQKKRFQEKRLLKALEWMRNNKIIPNGKGKKTLSKTNK